MIKLHSTERGFLRGEFLDRYGEKCSIQKSSIATEDCIWLGCEHESKHSVLGIPIGARMHLTRSMAAELAGYLKRFAETGDLK